MIKEYILERKGWFKGCKIRVEQDYNEEVCKIRRKLVEGKYQKREKDKKGKKVKISPLQALKTPGECECKGPHIHSHGTRKR